MAVTFTGTSTGKTYVEGQYYQSGNGDIKRANADGTFTNTRTGQVTVGSSQSDRVTWGTTGDGGHDNGAVGTRGVQPSSGGGSGAGREGVVSGDSRSVGAGPGGPAARQGAGAAVRGSVLGGGFLTGTPDETTDLYWNGVKLPKNAGTSDAQDWENRGGEVMGDLVGLGVIVGDFGSAILTDRVGQDLSKTPGWVSDGVVGFASHLDQERHRVLSERTPGDYYTGGGF